MRSLAELGMNEVLASFETIVQPPLILSGLAFVFAFQLVVFLGSDRNQGGTFHESA